MAFPRARAKFESDFQEGWVEIAHRKRDANVKNVYT